MTSRLRNLPPVLGGLSADVAEVFSEPLKTYVDRLRRDDKRARNPKIINDAIWKTVRVEPWEAVILDAFPLQRLRNICQLGLARLIYPGAGYSRFEHSVGVLYQTQRMIDSINRNATAANRGIAPILPLDANMLRLAGLLHDVGHGFLSHVSERAMSRISEFTNGGSPAEAIAEARVHFNTRKSPAFAEIVASLIVLRPEFIELLALANVPFWKDPELLADHIAHLLVGGNLDSARPFLGEIISGALDADKLDYMARDCLSAGLPMPIDVERLLQKLRVVAMSTATAEGASWAAANGLTGLESIYVMAVDQRGGIAAEELVLSRVMLYDKLYHHQKVRSFESLAGRILDLLIDACPKFRSPSTYLKLSDADFLEGRWSTGDAPLTIEDHDKFAIAQDIIKRIERRHDTVRAIAFSPAFGGDRPMQWRKIKPLVSRENNTTTSDFRARVVELAQAYLKTAGKTDIAISLRPELIIVDLPPPQNVSEKTRFFVGSDAAGVMFYSKINKIDRWAEAYEQNKSVGYVYCPSEHAIAVHLAVRKIFSETSNFVMDDRQVALTKIDTSEMSDFAALINERGGDAPQVDAKPTTSSVWIASRDIVESQFGATIEELAQKFRTYTPHSGPRVDSALITNWLLQFSSDNIPHAVKVLQSVDFWTRQRLTDAFAEHLEAVSIPDTQLLPLGGPTASASLISYFIDDLRKVETVPSFQVLNSLDEADPSRPIIFFDDFIGSGGQSATIIDQFYGVSKEDWRVAENHVEPLSDQTRERLAKSSISCVFAAGRNSGLDLLLSTIEKHTGRRPSGYISKPSHNCFRAITDVFSNAAEAKKAQTAFVHAGRKALSDRLLQSDKKPWDQAKLDSRVLGYGNSADLTVFEYNTPASALAALWSESSKSGTTWSPLFKRRPRHEG